MLDVLCSLAVQGVISNLPRMDIYNKQNNKQSTNDSSGHLEKVFYLDPTETISNMEFLRLRT